jgi:HAD superfamily hydrolase (TIGR01458 family)
MTRLEWHSFEGFLFDLDGVFFVGDSAIAGAVETITYLRSKGLACRFTTNTTTRCLDTLHFELRALNLPIEKGEIFSAPAAAVHYLRKLGDPKCYLLMAEDTKRDFAEFNQTDADPDVIVLGDIGDDWNYQIMNKLFHMIMKGAEIVALHKGRYWQTASGLQLDIGAFVAGLEYATGKTATITGKPSPDFFRMALSDLRVAPDKVAMIGDDLINDVQGAQRVGISGVLVKTGKYRAELVKASTIEPDAIIDSVAELMKLV